MREMPAELTLVAPSYQHAAGRPDHNRRLDLVERYGSLSRFIHLRRPFARKRMQPTVKTLFQRFKPARILRDSDRGKTVRARRLCSAGPNRFLSNRRRPAQRHRNSRAAPTSSMSSKTRAGTIFHVLEQADLIERRRTVIGVIDRARRLDHMQQHSGQHILSQAFVQACGAETRSFHLGSHTSTIDIELQSPTIEMMRAAEDIANAVVFEDRPMRVHLVNEEAAERLPLRKESAVRGDIRVIEVENFDWSPCGGTHAARTGQIGMIAIRSYERAKKITRVEFVCGSRALADYRFANTTAFAVARLFSAERDSSPEFVARAIQETKSAKKRIRDLLELAMIAEASEMLAAFRCLRRLQDRPRRIRGPRHRRGAGAGGQDRPARAFGSAAGDKGRGGGAPGVREVPFARTEYGTASRRSMRNPWRTRRRESRTSRRAAVPTFSGSNRRSETPSRRSSPVAPIKSRSRFLQRRYAPGDRCQSLAAMRDRICSSELRDSGSYAARS